MFMHGRSRMTIDPRIPTIPGRGMLGGAGGGAERYQNPIDLSTCIMFTPGDVV